MVNLARKRLSQNIEHALYPCLYIIVGKYFLIKCTFQNFSFPRRQSPLFLNFLYVYSA